MVFLLETRESSTSTAGAEYEYEYEYEKLQFPCCGGGEARACGTGAVRLRLTVKRLKQ